LTKLGNDYFYQIGLGSKTSSNKIALTALKNLEENPSFWQKVDDNLAKPILAIINAQKSETEDEIGQKGEEKIEDKKTKQTAPLITGSLVDQSSEKKPSSSLEQEQTQINIPEGFSREFNLARLDDRSKLYIRSLAIISINQSLQIQFANLTKEQLSKMGFDEIPNFNNLTLNSKQQLLNISFEKIETLLASGRYDLENLITNPSLRIGFAKDVALKIISNIRGGEIFAREIGKLTRGDLDPRDIKNELENNKNQGFNQKQVNEKLAVKNLEIFEDISFENLSTEEAEKFFSKLDLKNDLKADFLTSIKRSFKKVTKNNFLEEWKKIVINDRNAIEKSFLAQDNILPIIDVFIQQNYPANYINTFNWQRFQTHFGRDIINQNTYLANERAIKDLLISYWKSQRAEWSRTIHQGIDNEFYTAEDLEKIWKEFESVKLAKKVTTGNKIFTAQNFDAQTEAIIDNTIAKYSKSEKKILQKQAVYLQQLKNQAKYNLIDATTVTKILAGFPKETNDTNKFNKDQLKNLYKLNNAYQQKFLNIINDSGPIAQRTALNYYFPGEKYVLTQQITLQTESIPQFTAYDLGVLNYNQAFGPNEENEYPLTRTINEEGGIESKIQQGFAAAKNVAGQAIDFLGEKAVRAGLDYATGGAFESLPEPVKQMIEKMAWGAIKKTLEPIVKYLIALILAAFAALIALIFFILKVIGKIVSFFKFGSGGQQTTLIIPEKSISENTLSAKKVVPTDTNRLAKKVVAAENQNITFAQNQLPSAPAGTAASQLGQGVMATASQAVLTAFGIAAGGMMIYQTILNGAFLTQFPTEGGGGGGSAVFCDDVVVGHLTYYSQKDYSNIPICGGECSFGSSACGPVSIAMILNEDPIDMSIREGFLVPGGCGLTSCGGTSLDPLINTMNNNGVNVVSVPTPSGSPGQITDEISKYLSEGNLIFALTHTRGFGHYYVITCVESPGYVTAYDPWWGQNVVHKVVSTSDEGLISGTNNTYIRNMYLVQN
jgi:hypothetical protein